MVEEEGTGCIGSHGYFGRDSKHPTSDNLNPQETTKQDALDMGVDGADLSCPGSNVVADEDEEG